MRYNTFTSGIPNENRGEYKEQRTIIEAERGYEKRKGF